MDLTCVMGGVVDLTCVIGGGRWKLMARSHREQLSKRLARSVA